MGLLAWCHKLIFSRELTENLEDGLAFTVLILIKHLPALFRAGRWIFYRRWIVRHQARRRRVFSDQAGASGRTSPAATGNGSRSNIFRMM